jgi:AraC-like DNA-binding protein
MLTALAGLEDKMQALRIGVDDYLTKPFEEEELLVRTENLLQHQKQRLHTATLPDREAPGPQLSQADADWLARLESYALTQLVNTHFSVTDLAQAAFLSERQLQRRLREITGLGPQQYITELRMQKARELLDRGAYRTVAEVAYHSGFGNAKSFSRTYRERFGRLPTAYFKD